jgi:hypothetical protein
VLFIYSKVDQFYLVFIITKNNQMKKQIVITGLVLIVSLLGCSKKKGCTDSKATNFDASAKKDDGSCIYAPSSSGIVLVDVTSDRVLTNTDSEIDYILNSEIDVSAKLTIEPGVVIQCSNSGGMIVSGSSSTLKAIGTSAAPITFKSSNGEKGAWKGILFQGSNNVENELTYCIIADGGSGSFDGNATKKANIQMYGTSQLKLKNTSVNNSASFGIKTDQFSAITFSAFQNNSFNNNADAPMKIVDKMVPSLDGVGTTFSGNGKNYIHIIADDFEGVGADVTWKKQNIPYAFFNEGDDLVCGYYTTHGSITLNAGVTLLMGPDSKIVIGDNSNTTGYLKCLGTASEPVTIKGVQEQAGAWRGILVGTSSINNVWNYTNISHGGGAFLTGNSTKKTNVYIGNTQFDDAYLSISNCTTNNSFGCGYVLTGAASGHTITLSGTFTGSGNATALSCTN